MPGAGRRDSISTALSVACRLQQQGSVVAFALTGLCTSTHVCLFSLAHHAPHLQGEKDAQEPTTTTRLGEMRLFRFRQIAFFQGWMGGHWWVVDDPFWDRLSERRTAHAYA